MPSRRVSACECRDCGHVWLPRHWQPNNIPRGSFREPKVSDFKPDRCPQCKSRTWDRSKDIGLDKARR